MKSGAEYQLLCGLSIWLYRSVTEMPRKYELRQRAEREAETRQRIVEATVALHEEVGGLSASISAIAERAGVTRATVYRHFPDERSLLTACTGHYSAANPPPDPTSWREIADPAVRLRTALAAICAYYRGTEAMSDRASRDMREMPVLREVLAPALAYWESVRDLLAAGWPAPAERLPLVRAAIGHAIAFGTWRSLVREQGLTDEQAIAVMVAMVCCLATSGPVQCCPDENCARPPASSPGDRASAVPRWAQAAGAAG
jgi:AcrR family transcriptional regulator